MIYQRFMLLALIVLLSITYGAEAAAIALPWNCVDYKGVCRRFCLPAEFPFAIFSCGGLDSYAACHIFDQDGESHTVTYLVHFHSCDSNLPEDLISTLATLSKCPVHMLPLLMD